MTAHAKNLADALKGLLEHVFFDTRNCVYHDDGDCEPCASLDSARKALTAYEADQSCHADLVKRLRAMLEEPEYPDSQTIADAIEAISQEYS